MNIFPWGREYTEDIISFTGHTTEESKEASHENVFDIHFLTAYNLRQCFPPSTNTIHMHVTLTAAIHRRGDFPPKKPSPTHQPLSVSKCLSSSSSSVTVPSPHHISLPHAKAPGSFSPEQRGLWPDSVKNADRKIEQCVSRTFSFTKQGFDEIWVYVSFIRPAETIYITIKASNAVKQQNHPCSFTKDLKTNVHLELTQSLWNCKTLHEKNSEVASISGHSKLSTFYHRTNKK